MRIVVGAAVVTWMWSFTDDAIGETPRRGYFTTTVGVGTLRTENERGSELELDVYSRTLGMIRWAGGVELGRRECGTNHRIGGFFEGDVAGGDEFVILGLEYSADWPLGTAVRVGPRISLALASDGHNGDAKAIGV